MQTVFFEVIPSHQFENDFIVRDIQKSLKLNVVFLLSKFIIVSGLFNLLYLIIFWVIL